MSIGKRSLQAARDRVGAVVVGGDYQGLGIVRSLGRNGIPVCVVDDEHSIGKYSRYATFAVKAPSLKREAQTIDFLIAVARRWNLKGWVLFPTRDELVAAFARNRSRLMEWYRVPTPEWETIKWAWNKHNTYSLADKLGILKPRTWCPRDLNELDAIDADFPLCIKPAVKEDFFYATKAKAWRANNRDELKELFKRASDHAAGNEILIQEFIPGDGNYQFSCCVFMKNGVAVGSMTAQRRRQHPHEFGRATTYALTVNCPELEEPTLRFLKAIGYYGLAEVEFKLDPRDGQFKLLDVNARTWGFHGLGYSAGVDFPYLLYADQVGETVQSCQTRPGIGWIRMITDLPTSIAAIVDGRLDLNSYWGSLKRCRIESVFSHEDLLPTVMELVLLPYLAMKKGY